MSSNSVLWRHCKRFHQDLSVEAYRQCPEQEDSDSDVFVLGRECPSDSDHDASPERSMAEISNRVLDEDTRNQVAHRVTNSNYFETAGGGRARLSIAHSDVPLSILQHFKGTRGEYEASRTSEMHDQHFTNRGGRGNLRVAHGDVAISILQHTSTDHLNDYITRNTAGHTDTDTPLIRPDVRAAEQGARFIPTGNDTSNSRSSQDTPQPASWKFCTLNMTAFSTQHPAIFQLGCHVCGL